MNTYEGFAAMLCGQHDNAEAISAGPWPLGDMGHHLSESIGVTVPTISM